MLRALQHPRDFSSQGPYQDEFHLLSDELPCAVCGDGSHRGVPFSLRLKSSFSSPLFAALDLVLFILWMWLLFCNLTVRIPFVVVPHPFVLGEYRITPSCIVVGTAAVTALAFMLNVSFLGYFVVFHLLYALREC